MGRRSLRERIRCQEVDRTLIETVRMIRRQQVLRDTTAGGEDSGSGAVGDRV